MKVRLPFLVGYRNWMLGYLFPILVICMMLSTAIFPPRVDDFACSGQLGVGFPASLQRYFSDCQRPQGTIL